MGFYLTKFHESYNKALRPSDSLDINYGSPFFPIDCLLIPSLNLLLSQILFHIFQPSPSWSSPSSTSLRFTLTYFLNSPYLIHSYYMPNPFQSSWINWTNLMSLMNFFIAQHVSNVVTFILRSWWLYVGVLLCLGVYWCIGAVGALVLQLHSDTTLLQLNRTNTPVHTETEQYTYIQSWGWM